MDQSILPPAPTADFEQGAAEALDDELAAAEGKLGDGFAGKVTSAEQQLPQPVPDGWAPRVADNGKGIVFQDPNATGNANMIRLMDPTPKYPNGYIRVYNSYGQPVDVYGKPGPPSATHIPVDYDGEWSWWPGG